MPSGQLVIDGIAAKYNLTVATVIQTGYGRLARVSVIVAGSTPGTVNDCATTGAVAVTNQVAAIPNAIGTYQIDWPLVSGLVVVPGTGQTLAVSYE